MYYNITMLYVIMNLCGDFKTLTAIWRNQLWVPVASLAIHSVNSVKYFSSCCAYPVVVTCTLTQTGTGITGPLHTIAFKMTQLHFFFVG